MTEGTAIERENVTEIGGGIDPMTATDGGVMTTMIATKTAAGGVIVPGTDHGIEIATESVIEIGPGSGTGTGGTAIRSANASARIARELTAAERCGCIRPQIAANILLTGVNLACSHLPRHQPR